MNRKNKLDYNLQDGVPLIKLSKLTPNNKNVIEIFPNISNEKSQNNKHNISTDQSRNELTQIYGEGLKKYNRATNNIFW